MLGAGGLADEEQPCGDDEDTADHERRLDRLVEEEDRHRGGEERGGSDDDGCARGPGVPDSAREEKLRGAGRDQPCEGEEGGVPKGELRAFAVEDRGNGGEERGRGDADE